MKKVIHFYYKRDSLPHSEYKVIQSLKKFLEDKEKLEYKISTSTTSIFNVVRYFCFWNKIELIANYEDYPVFLDENMKIQNNCEGELTDFRVLVEEIDLFGD